jgi:hypothetical protein
LAERLRHSPASPLQRQGGNLHERLTIDRPADLGTALSAAVHTVCAHELAVVPNDLTALDARLACGDFESVLALLRAAGSVAALPLFVARYVRWSGDLHGAAAIWPRVLEALDLALTADDHASLHRAICTELAPVATDLGDVQLAARLHGIARTSDATALPPDEDGAAADAAAVVRGIAFDTIGIDPDAARGRLRLRPRLDRLDELIVRGIRFGDGSVSLRAGWADEVLSIRVQQDAGGLPITVLLEPFLAGPGAAMVDGRPADLVAQSVDRGTILPVQLVLDEERTLVVTKKGRSPT